LGATLYEVLTRRAVCDGEDRETILRQLMTEEPVALRRHDPRIPLDLETIILKSVSRQRDDRYATAQELADDLQRLLDDRPILARRPTLSQRVAKWTRRHRSATAAGVGALMLLSVGLLISNIAIARQKAATERALQIATANEARAVTEQRKAAAIRDVMQQLVGAAHPDQRKGNTYTVRQLLDNLSSELIAPLDDQQEVQAALRSTVGNAYRRLGAPDKAAPLLSAVLTMRQAARPLDQVALAESLKDVAWNEAAQSRYAQAEDYARQAVALYEQHGPPAPPRINALWCLQHSLIYQQKYLQADQTAQQAMELGGPIPEAQADLSNVLHNLAQSKNLQGKPVEAEALAREAVTLHRAIHGDRHPETAWGLDALGRALASQKKWSEAAASFREAMGIFSEHYDAGHKSVRQADENLRMVLRAQGDHDGIAELDRRRTELTAQAFLRQRIHDRTLLDLLVEHDQVLAAAQLLELGEPQLLDQTELIQAATMMARCAQDVLKPHDSAQCELAGQRFRLAARRLIEKAVQACPQDAHAENQLAWWLVSHDDPSLHDPAQAIQLARQALDKQPDADHVWNTLGVALYRDGQWAEAIEALERSCQGKGGGPYDLVFLAMAHWQLGHTDQARTLFARAQHLASTEPHSHELQGFLDEARALLDNPR
jgi:tetratricopeptide (TPR) repeat protein